jgi:hypothetical protein
MSGASSRYWTLIRIDARRGCKREEIASAKVFFWEHFPDFASGQDVPEQTIQCQLLRWVRGEELEGDASKQTLAGLCLRCYISKQIELACVQLETKFGSNHGFTRYDLFPFVLTDVLKGNDPTSTPRDRSQSTYTSPATEILRTFRPERGSLSTWTTRLVKHHRELRAFLLEQGVYLVSDWAILNDTAPDQLSRICSEFHQLTTGEIEQRHILLESYHAVYRRDRLMSPGTGMKGQCRLPTTHQLQQIAHHFYLKTNQMLPTQAVMQRLQELADLLRQYRLSIRRGLLPTESLDDPNLNREASIQLSNNYLETDDVQKLQSDFLAFYRQQFIRCLDQALKQVIGDRIAYLQRKKSNTSQEFITALHLFHCQGKAMGEIAPLVGLQAQYQVSRLLKLKQLRADVKQKMLKALLDCISEEVATLSKSESLPTLNQQQLQVVLDEEIARIIQEAEIESEVNSNRNSPLKSQFSRRLCHSLRSEQLREKSEKEF